MVNAESLVERVTKAGQPQLLQFWDQLTDEQQNHLSTQLEQFDLDHINAVFKSAHSLAQEYSTPKIDDALKVKPIDGSHYGCAADTSCQQLAEFTNTGLTAIANGELGVIVMAGGQATRLGASQPKGIIPMGLAREHDTLLQMQASQIKKLQSLAKAHLPDSSPIIHWFIMTSAATTTATQEHVQTQIVDTGILLKEQIHFMCQNEMPCFTPDGKMMLKEKHVVATSPDGNGGLYAALKPQLDTIVQLGIKSVHVYCVDNILCRVADPVFCGYCLQNNADCAAKVVMKTDPTEAVGVVCQVDGVPKVLEYSEIPLALSEQKDESDPNKLALRAGNIANHFFTTEFLQRVCAQPLPFHPASKKIPTVDENGQTVAPKTPNGIKMEQFVFDVFVHSKSFFVWEVSRADEFSPLKNAEAAGKDCMSTCRRDLWKLTRGWIERAGGKVELTEGNESCEIEPSVTYAGEGLETLVAGKVFNTPVLIK